MDKLETDIQEHFVTTLRERAEELKKEKKFLSKELQENYLEFFLFRFGKNLFAVEIAIVSEVIDFTTVIPLPCTPDHLLGVLNLRGEIVALMDIQKFLGIKEFHSEEDEYKAVVLETETFNTAVLVNDVVEKLKIKKELYSLLLSEAIDNPYIHGVINRKGESIPVLSLRELFKQPEFFIGL